MRDWQIRRMHSENFLYSTHAGSRKFGRDGDGDGQQLLHGRAGGLGLTAAALKDLMKADPAKEFSRTVMMCGEKVQLVRNPGEATARVVFEDGSE